MGGDWYCPCPGVMLGVKGLQTMMRSRFGELGVLCVVLMCAGCRSGSFSQTFWNPFELELPFAQQEPPVRIGVTGDLNSLWNVRAWWDTSDRTPWTEFRRALGQHLGRPIQVEQLKPFQLALQLESGRLDFALLDDAGFSEVTSEVEGCRVIARALANKRVGLIVASAKSEVASIEQVSGHRFAFGPRGDPVLHLGAAAALEEGGVSIEGIQRELIPIDTLQYHTSSQEVAKEVVYGLTPVGVVDQADYESYPESGGTLIPLTFGQDQFRVLGRTKSFDPGPFVAGPVVDQELVSQVHTFLVTTVKDKPVVTNALGIASFVGVE